MAALRIIGAFLARVAISSLILGVCVTGFCWPQRDLIAAGHNDFPAFYTAGALAGGPDLYRKEPFLARQAASVGVYDENIQFVRLPYYALLFEPFARLPYPVAYWLWQFLCVAALAGFSALWPGMGRLGYALCMLPPVIASFANGQDIPFVLLWTALGVYLLGRNRPIEAGLALSLCLAKFHLFLLVPIALASRRKWTVLIALCGGTAALLLLSFAAGGPSWPKDLLRVWSDPLVHPRISGSSMTAALLQNVTQPWARNLAVASIFAVFSAIVWILARRTSIEIGVAAALLGGVLANFHVYLQDYSLALPLAAIILARLNSASATEPASVPRRSVLCPAFPLATPAAPELNGGFDGRG